jgi:hypothetical protein
MAKITVTNAHGTFTTPVHGLDIAIRQYLPASVNDLTARLREHNPAFDYSDVHYVSEALIMLADIEHPA